MWGAFHRRPASPRRTSSQPLAAIVPGPARFLIASSKWRGGSRGDEANRWGPTPSSPTGILASRETSCPCNQLPHFLLLNGPRIACNYASFVPLALSPSTIPLHELQPHISLHFGSLWRNRVFRQDKSYVANNAKANLKATSLNLCLLMSVILYSQPS